MAKARSSTHAGIVLVEDTNSFKEMDDVIRAELPHAHEDPVLHDLVKPHMLHGPCACGALNPNVPCMKDGGVHKTVPTQPSERDTNRERWVSIVSKVMKRWRSQSSPTSKLCYYEQVAAVIALF